MLTIILLIFAFLSLLLIKSIRDGSKKGRIASVFTDNIRYFNVQEFFNSGGIGYSLGIDEVKNSIVLVGSDLQFTVIPINELDGIHLYSNQEILKSSLPEEKKIVNSISENNIIVLELILKKKKKKNPT
ncbi:MAG: hypothetical protein KDC84_13740, partial [Crocinitomicaceae bacterium]|nr:hypothetical protein [Crocinitomicaceae bacterium]